jgi:ABC-2 type transport system ATP-binding protein
MQQRLAVAAALLTDPEVLLLDEPTAGLDPTGSLLVMEVIAERAAAGCAVLMASHHLQEVEQTCDRVYLLSRGRKLAEGSLDELLASGEQHLRLVAPDAAARASVEAAARESGCEVVGWEAGRTHLFELFRRLTGAESETLEQG